MHYVIKMAVELHTFVTLDVDGGHWLDSHPCRFTPKGNSPRMHWSYRNIIVCDIVTSTDVTLYPSQFLPTHV
jgi:hypothetical protein